MALAPDSPTSREPISPGPQVTATASPGGARWVAPGSLERLDDHGLEVLDVGPPGDLGDDAAEAGVQVDLARDHRGEDSSRSVTTAAAVSSQLVSMARRGDVAHEVEPRESAIA